MLAHAMAAQHASVRFPIRAVLARCVLVVDDDPMICLLLREMIEQIGHGVCGSASSEATAMALASIHRPDLLIVDAWLGADSWLDTTTRILRAGFIPHIFISGNIYRVRRFKPHALLLEKPFTEAALTEAMQRALTDPPPPRALNSA